MVTTGGISLAVESFSSWFLATQNGLKLRFLGSVFFDLEHDLLRFLNVSLFSLLLGIIGKEINFLLKLVNSRNELVLLELAQLRQI
jgi:hypothetical protein